MPLLEMVLEQSNFARPRSEIVRSACNPNLRLSTISSVQGWTGRSCRKPSFTR